MSLDPQQLHRFALGLTGFLRIACAGSSVSGLRVSKELAVFLVFAVILEFKAPCRAEQRWQSNIPETPNLKQQQAEA